MLGRLLLVFRSALSGRRRGQGVVEYGLIAASLAFVGAVGFNALAGAEQGYLTGMPTNPVPPSAPGALLHPSSVDAPTCNLNVIPLGTNLQCNTVVRDMYSNAMDRNPPWGSVIWLLDGVQLGPASPPTGCVMPAITSGSANTCPAPGLSWTPTDATLIGSHNLTAVYQNPASNHFAPSSSPPIVIQIQPNIQFQGAGCRNDLALYSSPTWSPPNSVGLGYPVHCQVQVVNGGTPMANQTVTWSTQNGTACSPSCGGVGTFTCFTGYDPLTGKMTLLDIRTQCALQPIVPNGTASMTCTTSASGWCSVIYRRLYDFNLQGTGPSTLTISGSPMSPTSATVQVLAPKAQGGSHGTNSIAQCASTDPTHVDVDTTNVAVGNAIFLGTNTAPGIVVSGVPSGTVTCTAYVLDTDPNPATTTIGSAMTGGDPDFADAYPPAGPAFFKYNGVTVAQCTLLRVDYSASNPAMAPGQEPFFSSCTVSTPIVLANTAPGNTLTLEYDGELPLSGPNVGHGFSNYPIPIIFS